MPLDPQAQKVVDTIAALNLKPIKDSTPAEARESMRTRTAGLGPVEDVPAVADHRVPVAGGEITVRVYAPAGRGPHPVLVFYHGGGWVIGDLYTHDGICRSIVNAAGCAVASVDYRLAPEFKYPLAVEDSYTALKWVVANAVRLGLDPARVAVGGDSAGGNLAAVVALTARDTGDLPIAFQLLIYPATDQRRGWPSHAANGQGYLLTKESMDYYHDHYLPDPAQDLDWRASPLLHANHAKLPPAFVLTAGYDPLRDEGLQYAHKLSEGGNRAALVNFERQIHGFITMGRVIDEANVAVQLCAAQLKHALS